MESKPHDLSHWDFAESFDVDEAMRAILGISGEAKNDKPNQEKMALVIRRMSSDYQSAGCALLGLLSQEDGTKISRITNQPILQSEMMEAALEAAQKNPEFGFYEFDGWLAEDDSRFTRQTFSRAEIARWLAATGLKSVYQFERQTKGDIEQAPKQSGWPWGNHNTELLGHLDAAVKRFWVNFDPTDNTTAPTNEAVIAWLKERGLSGNIAKAIATIIRVDGLPTGKRT